jgi:uncharacterized metal-binding protein YceD (DUF177 family)
MHPLIEYHIPVRGLKSGSHSFVFKVDKEFFEHFQNSIIEEGSFEVKLDLEKRPELMLLSFSLQGHMDTECDRCLAPIELPINQETEILVKFGDIVESDDIDVIFLAPDVNTFDISQLVYEFILLSVPLIKVYNCQDSSKPPCNFSMLEFLTKQESKEGKPFNDPTWDILKDIN